jgi:aerobic carbon-monoxide dehydrogenase large subunit
MGNAMTRPYQDITAYARDETAFLRGEGRYVDDLRSAGEAHGYVLRSPHAHARIRVIDAVAARQAAGVLVILTGADLAGTVHPLGCVVPLTSIDGTPRAEADRMVLAVEKVRHVGDAVAFIVAETLAQAQGAAEQVTVEYEVLPAVVEPGPSPVPVWDTAPDNQCFDWQYGDPVAARRLFAEAAHISRISVNSPRVAPLPLEPRAALGIYDPAGDSYTLVTGTQGPHFVRRVLARAFGLPEEKLRVVTPNVGGGFGSKIFAYPEQALVLAGSRATGRPVRWTSSRAEAMLSDIQARDHHTTAEIALDAEGRFLAIHVRITVNMGAYLSQYAPLTATGVGAVVQGGAYRFQAIEIDVKGMFTNTVPVDSFRGAGRPEATYVLERLIDHAAADLGLDPAELRARNLPEARAESFQAVTGMTIDGGRFLDNQRRCLAAGDRAGFAARRAESKQIGRLRGFGFANYLESNGGLLVASFVEPDRLAMEGAALRFGIDGTLDIVIGTQSTGQDHALPLVHYAAVSFGLAADKITVRQGDTGSLGRGGGTGGSKSLLTSSVALEQAVVEVAAKGRALLAREWNVDEGALEFVAGIFGIAGSNQRMSIAEIAAGFPEALDGEYRGVLKHGSCANGCHACEIEIDPDTGEVHLLRYTAVDDFGEVLNEPAVRGQVQGGVAQGIGQALLEHVVYESGSGQIMSGTLSDYAVPRALDVPVVNWINNGLRSQTNIFGAKACGEAGVSAAPPAVMNAIANALSPFPAAPSLQMPAIPGEIWRVIHAPG